MKQRTLYYIYLLTVVAFYYTISYLLFKKVNKSVVIVIDELFHLPQGKAYCEGNFTHWDNKITTLPGLYLISSGIRLFTECTTFNLRLVNLIASGLNLMLFSSILHFIYGSIGESQFKIVLQAFNLAILPPLYFFSHVYYTDTLSLTFLLAFSKCSLMNSNRMSILILGLCSVLMRQTNIVWIAMMFGHKILDILIKSSRVYGNNYIRDTPNRRSLISNNVDKSKLKRYYGLHDVYLAVHYHLSTCLKTFFQFLTIHDWSLIATYMVLLGSFASFVFWNGSIVVGDKASHVPSVHIPQMFYFLLFYGVFGFPYVLAKLSSTLTLMFKTKLLVVLLLITFLMAVHYNTVTHPYLLADNRHYTFYVWNRWFGKYDFAVYVTTPLYVFLLYSLYDNLRNQNCIAFLLPYTLCAFIVLSLQKMIEVRYFMIPYIILRLRFSRPSHRIVLLEFFWYLLLNIATYYVFFTKNLVWKDFNYTQRIIW